MNVIKWLEKQIEECNTLKQFHWEQFDRESAFEFQGMATAFKRVLDILKKKVEL